MSALHTGTPSTACELCGLPVLGRPVLAQGSDGLRHDFCCQGCKRVWAVAAEHGFDMLLAGPVTARTRAADAAARKAAAAAIAGARRETFRVEGMWCSSCSLILEEALFGLAGVLDAEVSYAASLARITYDPHSTNAEEVAARICLLGYHATPAREIGATDEGRDVADLFLRFFVGAVVSMWVMWPTLFMLYPAFARGRFGGVSGVELFTGALSLVVLLYPGWLFLRGALHAARVRRATMDTLVALGTWTAWFYSLWATLSGAGGTYFESAAMITVIVLLGRLIESAGRGSAAKALAGLQADAHAEAWRLPTETAGFEEAERVPAGSLVPGDSIAVRAGERILADGVVLRGESDVDQARLTGEALAAARATGDEVFAGTINLTGLLVVRVTRGGADTLTGRIAALVEDAAFAKAHAQRLADAIAGIFVPVVFAIAAATLLITGVSGPGWDAAVGRAVAVLVVSCPCALGLATPLAVANAVSAANRRGLLLRGGTVLERAGQIAAVGFDKTGTLTTGRLALYATVPASLAPDAATRMLDLAAALEAGNPHPVAVAIVEAARSAHASSPVAANTATASPVTPAAAVDYRSGLGVAGAVSGGRVLVGSPRLLELEGVSLPQAMSEEALRLSEGGHTLVWVAEDSRVLGGLALADEVRPDAAAALAAIRARGVHVVMVSGDGRATSTAMAAVLGIDDVRAEVLPNDKEQVVRELSAEFGSVAFVGDGINDAPALATADLSIAIGGGSDVALEASDVVLLGSSGHATGETAAETPLSALPYMLKLAARARRIIGQNLAWAFTYNVIALPLAVSGALSPIAAAAAMALSSLAVVANSLRLRPVR